MNAQVSHYELRLATDAQDIRAAQRLRYAVFVEELGATCAQADHAARLEQDAFDPFYDHLILVDKSRDPATLDHVVGVYRLLREEAAEQAGQFYSEGEYDLAPLRRDGRKLLELGRSCVAPHLRGGLAILQLWEGLAAYVAEHQIELLFGVASFHGTDVQALSEPLSMLHHNHLAPAPLRVPARAEHAQSMNLIASEALDRPTAMRQVPSLIKAYLRLGGVVGEGAYVDHAFNTTDVCLIMDTAQMSRKSRARYGAGAARVDMV